MKAKKIISLLLAAVLVLSFAACGEKAPPDDPNTLVIGTNTAEYKGCRMALDSEGNDAIIIDFTYHNGGEEAESFEWAYYYTVMQGDTEMEYAVVWVSEDSFDTLDESIRVDVAPGESKDVSLTYKLVDKTTPIIFSVSDLFDEEHDSITIDPATAVAMPQESETEEPAGAPEAPEGGEAGFYLMTHSESEDPQNVIDEETMAMLQGMGLAMYIELREDGTGTFMLDEAYEVTWGDGVIELEDETVTYVLNGDELVIDEYGTLFYFVLSDPSVLETMGAGSEDFWLGDWYGWWTITDGDGYYADLIGACWDCCAYIEPYEDNYLMTIWDTDFNDYVENPLAEVVLGISGLMAFTENGVASSLANEGNFFWAGGVGEGDWYMDPGFVDDDDTVVISSEYVDGDGDRLEYSVYLTKWPSEWNTSVVDSPMYYESFFRPLMEEGGELPAVFEP